MSFNANSNTIPDRPKSSHSPSRRPPTVFLPPTEIPASRVSESESNFSHDHNNSPLDYLDASNPFSAFYSHESHPGASSKCHLTTNVAELHNSAGDPSLVSQPGNAYATPKYSIDSRVKESSAWPSRQALAEKAAAEKDQRSCFPMRKLSARQRMWVKILIASVFIAVAVGVGIGVSRAVGGGVWAGNGKSTKIPPNRR